MYARDDYAYSITARLHHSGTSVPDLIHNTKFVTPVTEVLKVYNNIVPSIFNDIFDERNL